MADAPKQAGAPKTWEEKEAIGCKHEMIPSEDGKEYIMHCVFPKGNPDGTDRKFPTERMLFMGKICTKCLLTDTEAMFKLTDTQLREERELLAKKEKEKGGG